jgi:hypothetical protein
LISLRKLPTIKILGMRDNNRLHSGRATVWAIVIALAPIVAYVLSFGPASRLTGRLNRTEHHETIEFICWLYLPITYLGEQCEPFQTVMDHYAWLWG